MKSLTWKNTEKLGPRHFGPCMVLERIGEVAYVGIQPSMSPKCRKLLGLLNDCKIFWHSSPRNSIGMLSLRISYHQGEDPKA